MKAAGSGILTLENISKHFGDLKAVDCINLDIPKQVIFGLLGPNVAGKTTLIRIITGILAADSGRKLFHGEVMRSEHYSAISYMPEERGLYKKMKVGEHLLYLIRLKGLSARDAKKEIGNWMEKFEIADWWDRKIEDLSKGMQQKVQFIATVANRPELLILDEPFSGLDPVNTNLIKQIINELKEAGTTIIFSTHRMEQVEQICDEIVLVDQGKNVLEGSVADVKRSYKEHKFMISWDGDYNPANDLSEWDVLERKDREAVIKFNGEGEHLALIRQLINSGVQINSFQEILPSLNEIFIRVVNNGTNE